MSTRSNTGVGIRSTKQRTAVIKALEHFDDFRSSQEIHDYLRHSGDSVGLTTVYRTLTALATCSLLSEQNIGHQPYVCLNPPDR